MKRIEFKQSYDGLCVTDCKAIIPIRMMDFRSLDWRLTGKIGVGSLACRSCPHCRIKTKTNVIFCDHPYYIKNKPILNK